MVGKLLKHSFFSTFFRFFCFDNIRARIFTTLRHNFWGEILDSLLRPSTLYYFILYLYNWSKNSLVYDSRSKSALSRSKTWTGTVFKWVGKKIISHLLYLILYDSSLSYGCSLWFYVSICVLSWWGIMQKCLFTTPCIPGQEYKRHGKHGCMT